LSLVSPPLTSFMAIPSLSRFAGQRVNRHLSDNAIEY